MSTYIQFFIRCEDKFVPMCSYSRNHELFRSFYNNNIPCGKIIPITKTFLNEVRSDLADAINMYNERKLQEQHIMDFVLQFSNSVDDKLKALNDIQESIEVFDNDLKELGWCIHTVDLFKDILESAEYHYEDCPFTDYTESTVLYAGIEVPEFPTIDDILDSNDKEN